MDEAESTKSCECGCGGLVIERYTYGSKRHGSKKGELKRFLRGHAALNACAVYAERLTGKRPKIAHGFHRRAVHGHATWSNMLARCRNPKCSAYPNYGGRGISVCDRWLSFDSFIEDMGEQPKGMTLERVDNNKGYNKENCIWADRFQQAANTRKNVTLTLNNRTQHVTAWARELNISPYTLFYRIKIGWPDEAVLMTPIRPKPPNRKARIWKDGRHVTE